MYLIYSGYDKPSINLSIFIIAHELNDRYRQQGVRASQVSVSNYLAGGKWKGFLVEGL